MRLKDFIETPEPMKVEFFSCSGDTAYKSIEHDINIWLKDKPNIYIQHIEQSVSYGDYETTIVVSVWYRE